MLGIRANALPDKLPSMTSLPKLLQSRWPKRTRGSSLQFPLNSFSEILSVPETERFTARSRQDRR
jgi:hypothetical protein